MTAGLEMGPVQADIFLCIRLYSDRLRSFLWQPLSLFARLFVSNVVAAAVARARAENTAQKVGTPVEKF